MLFLSSKKSSDIFSGNNVGSLKYLYLNASVGQSKPDCDKEDDCKYIKYAQHRRGLI